MFKAKNYKRLEKYVGYKKNNKRNIVDNRLDTK